MKFVVTFFLYLFFLLIGGNKDAQAMAHSYNHFFGQRIGETKQRAESLMASHGLSISKSSDVVGDDNQIVNVEDDDEGHEDLIRKHLLQARYILAFSYVFILQYESSHQPDRLPFSGYFSYSSTPKYIVQRVLRV